MFDTRAKIVEWDQFRERLLAPQPPAAIVIGHFDPLVYLHTERLNELADKYGPLAICITSPPDPLMPARARAELVAALSCTEFLAIVEREEVSVLAATPGVVVVDETHNDILRRDQLMRLVIKRQKA